MISPGDYNKTVSGYDSLASKVVMKNHELQDVLLTTIPFDKDKQLSVLDLGCGTCDGALRILNQFPNSRITAIDYLSEMLEQCAVKCNDFSSRLELVNQNMLDFSADPQSFDLVISAIAIHNLEHPEKIDLFRKIYGWLRPGGYFINADFIEGETSFVDEQYRFIYKKYLEENLTGDELQKWLYHAFTEDKPMKLSEQFSALVQCGFTQSKLVWQFNNEAVYRTVK